MTKKALVLGITGGIGRASAEALVKYGWQISALHRNIEVLSNKMQGLELWDIYAGDSMNAEDVLAAAKDADVIVHAVNPPNYKNWKNLAIPMLRNSIEAARSVGARLVFPGNIYNYGPEAGTLINEDTPQLPSTEKGKVRVEMEQMLRDAAKDGVRSLVVRSGDYFSGNAPSSWFENLLVKPGREIKSITYPGSPAVGHSWTYLPDLGEAIAQLLEKEDSLKLSDTFNFGGYYFEQGEEFLEVIRDVAGKPRVPTHRMPWFLIRLFSPFVTFFKEVLEMRYLWQIPHKLDNSKLVSFLGREPRTPVKDAVRESLSGLGCV